MFDPDGEWWRVLRRGAATDLIDQVAGALATPHSAYAPGQRSV